jgi:Tol biopolymer transport system component
LPTKQNPRKDNWPDWSPDGSEIVVDSSYLTDTGFSEIEVMDATGTVFRQLTHNGPQFDNFGQFSPDGKRIAWAHDPDGLHSAIYTMEADDGGNVLKVTPDWLFAARLVT